MKSENPILADMLETVTRLRDEVRVQANLSKKEAEDEFQVLEEKWKSIQKERGRIKSVVGETAHEAAGGVRLILEDLREGYGKLRSRK